MRRVLWPKIWASNTTRRKKVWQCNDKYKHDTPCRTLHLTEDEIKQRFLTAFNALMGNRDALLADCRLAVQAICNCSDIDAELNELRQELSIITELFNNAIHQNARAVIDQEEFAEQNKGYSDRHSRVSARIDQLQALRRQRMGKVRVLETFMQDIQSRPLIAPEFDEELWQAVVDTVTMLKNGGLVFQFKDGTEIQA